MARFGANVAYASGNFGKSLVGSFLEIFALFYLTDILQVSPTLAGLILLLSLVWDGVTDPIMGIIADRLRKTLSTVKSFFYVGAPVTAIAFIAFFNADRVAADFQLAYLLVTLLICRSAYTVVDVPHNAMLALITNDARERTNLASLRIFFSSVGRIGVTLAALYLLADSSVEASTPRFATASVLLACAYLAILGICLRSVARIEIRSSVEAAGFATSLRAVLQSVAKNRQLLIVFGLTALTSTTVPILSNTILYFAKYQLQEIDLASVALLLLASTQAVSLLFWSKFSNRLAQKKHASQLANTILAGTCALFMLTLSAPLGLYALALLSGVAIGGIHMLNWSMLPDAMDDRGTVDGERHDMSIFGLYTLTNKICMGIAQALTGLVLAAYGYEANSEVPAGTIGAIIATLLALPALGSFGCCWLLRHQTLRQSTPIAEASG